MKLIDKDKVAAEIERLISNGQVKLQESQESNDHENYIVWSEHIATCIKVLSLIDTLEMKEVDIEKEFDNYTKDILACDVQYEPFTYLYNCAKYFYELGLKAKGE